MTVELWFAFLSASIIICVIPGPTVVLAVSYALSQGRGAALAVTAGVALGDCIAMSASLLGVGALMQTSAALFTGLKLVGAGYLIWLGWKMWRAGALAAAEAPALPKERVFQRAFIVTALNPKGIAFFVAFVPQFMDPAGDASLQASILIATFVGVGAANALAYALLADRAGRFLRRPRAMAAVNRVGGAVLGMMGVMLLFTRRA